MIYLLLLPPIVAALVLSLWAERDTPHAHNKQALLVDEETRMWIDLFCRPMASVGGAGAGFPLPGENPDMGLAYVFSQGKRFRLRGNVRLRREGEPVPFDREIELCDGDELLFYPHGDDCPRVMRFVRVNRAPAGYVEWKVGEMLRETEA